MEQKITLDARNYRKHSQRNKDIIRKSLQELGAGRSVLIDSEGSLIAGNGVFEQAKALRIPVRVIESDGSELVVVKRTDLKTDDDKRRKLALADNAASDLPEWDIPVLQADWAKDALSEFGVESPEMDVNKVLDEADFESLNEVTRNRTGLKQITFLLTDKQAAIVNAYIKQNSKEAIVTKIVELCQQQEVK